MRQTFMVCTMVAALAPLPARGADWAFHVAVGTAYNVPVSLVVRQEGEEPLRTRARYATRGLRLPLYYVVRATRWQDEGGWAFELRHHKLFLERRPDAIQQFDVSHGYNLLSAYRVRRGDRHALGLGAGVVIAHPENQVRGRPLGADHGVRGYVPAGLGLCGFAVREIPLGEAWRAGLELATTASWARVPVAGGSADAPNVGIHGTVGLGRR